MGYTRRERDENGKRYYICTDCNQPIRTGHKVNGSCVLVLSERAQRIVDHEEPAPPCQEVSKAGARGITLEAPTLKYLLENSTDVTHAFKGGSNPDSGVRVFIASIPTKELEA